MAAVSKGSALKIKQTNQDGLSKVKIESSSNKRKFESSSKQPIDPKKKTTKIVTKSEVKSETKSATSKTTETKTSRVREKKATVCLARNMILLKRMMEHGLLSLERAKKAFDKKQRKQKQLRSGTPIKSSKLQAKPETSKRQPQ